jgi:hypothetical protein
MLDCADDGRLPAACARARVCLCDGWVSGAGAGGGGRTWHYNLCDGARRVAQCSRSFIGDERPRETVETALAKPKWSFPIGSLCAETSPEVSTRRSAQEERYTEGFHGLALASAVPAHPVRERGLPEPVLPGRWEWLPWALGRPARPARERQQRLQSTHKEGNALSVGSMLQQSGGGGSPNVRARRAAHKKARGGGSE